eukprot:5558595-Pyramimonas_sp.AAC.1
MTSFIQGGDDTKPTNEHKVTAVDPSSLLCKRKSSSMPALKYSHERRHEIPTFQPIGRVGSDGGRAELTTHVYVAVLLLADARGRCSGAVYAERF